MALESLGTSGAGVGGQTFWLVFRPYAHPALYWALVFRSFAAGCGGPVLCRALHGVPTGGPLLWGGGRAENSLRVTHVLTAFAACAGCILTASWCCECVMWC